MAALRVQPSNSCWLFISDSDEPRHLSDIVYAWSQIRSRGVSPTDVYVFTDYVMTKGYLGAYGLRQIAPVSEFKTRLPTLKNYEAAIIAITGHGDPTGIGSSGSKLSAYAVCAAVRTIPGLKLGLLVLCQCYAGIFNFVDARTAPPIVMLGATNLNESLSTGISLPAPILPLSGGTVGLQSWIGNIFMYFFFSWLAAPTDIDGDGNATLVDGYKAAGTESNQALSKIVKVRKFKELENETAHLKTLQAAKVPDVVAIAAQQQIID